MNFEQIMSIIVAAAPSLTAIIGIIAAVVKNKSYSKEVISKFEETRKAVMDTKQYEDLKTQLKIAHQENYELKKKINELLTKIDHIQRKEDE